LKRLSFLISLLFLLVVPPAAAQSGPIALEVEAGFGGTLKSGAWAPIIITATNTGADVRGRLEWRWVTGGPGFAQTIDLPRGAKKRIVLPVLVETFGSDARLEFVDGTRVLASMNVRSNPIDSSILVAGVLSDAGAGLPELASLPNPSGTGTTLVRLDVSTLPDRWELLQSLDLLFVHATDTATWSDAQRTAVDLWVADGGKLVIGGDQPATSAGIGRQSPATARARAGSVSLAELRPALNWAPRAGAPPVPILGLEPLPGATVVATSTTGLPLIVRRDHGRGVLLQTAFDLAAPSTQGDSLALWQRLFPSSGVQPLWMQLRSNGDSVLREALALPALRLPSIWTLLGFLGLYIFLVGPANYLVLRRLDRREWAYVTIPLTVVLFTLGAYSVGAAGRGGAAAVTTLSIVRVASGSDTGLSLSYVGIFSPGRRDYRVGFGPDMLVGNTPSFGRRTDELQVVRGEAGVELPSFLVDVGALRAVVAEQPVPAPPVSVTVRRDGPANLQLNVENHSDTPLEDVGVMIGDSIHKIPDVASREQRTIEIDLNQGGGEPEFRPDGVIRRSAAVNALRWSFSAIPVPMMVPDPTLPGKPVPGGEEERPVYLLAWSGSSQVAVTLDDVQQEVRGDTLFLWTATRAQ
jgi:hypothetical protein